MFVAYTTAGYPTIEETVPILLAFQEGGADIIEVGVPHSDPIGDGPVIQSSSLGLQVPSFLIPSVALENGITTASCIDLVREARSKGLTVPVIFMGYTNPFFNYGEEKLVKESKAAGTPNHDLRSHFRRCRWIYCGGLPS